MFEAPRGSGGSRGAGQERREVVGRPGRRGSVSWRCCRGGVLLAQQIEGEVAQMAKFSAAWPTRTRLSSSRKATSSTQCRRFSMPQWPRTARASARGVRRQAGQVVAGLGGDRRRRRGARARSDRRCAGPARRRRVEVGQQLRVARSPSTAPLDAARGPSRRVAAGPAAAGSRSPSGRRRPRRTPAATASCSVGWLSLSAST